MRADTDKLEKERSNAVADIDVAASIQDDLSEEDRPHTNIYVYRALNSRDVAITSILLGEVDVSKDYFELTVNAKLDYINEIVEYPHEIARSGGHKTRPKHARKALAAALLANDEQLVQRGIDACRKLPESYPEEHELVELYWRARAFAEVVAESGAVDDLLGQYESVRYDTKDGGWLDVLHGLHESDAERVTVGLHTLLGEWADETDPDVTDAETLLDVDTAALYVLARRRGLNVELNHERFPEQVEDLVSD
jgi:hypothetical protein